MPDNVAIDPGTTTPIATDDVGGIHYQKMKLFTAEADSAEPIGDDDKGAARALWIVERRNVVTSQVNSAGLTTGATPYAAGDVLGNGWEITGAARAAGGTGVVTGAVVVDVADVVVGVDLYLASGSITFGTDNAAPTVSDADAAKLLPVIGLAAIDVGGARVLSASGIAVPYTCDATSLWVYARTREAHNQFGAVSDLKLRLFVELD